MFFKNGYHKKWSETEMCELEKHLEIEFDVFKNNYHLVENFVKHCIYYRELYPQYKSLEIESEFWVMTMNSHFINAVIN